MFLDVDTKIENMAYNIGHDIVNGNDINGTGTDYTTLYSTRNGTGTDSILGRVWSNETQIGLLGP